MHALAKLKIDCRLPANAPVRRLAQRGSFLLEALIAVLIVAFGVLGLIGLQARAIQNVDDAQYRAEAAFLANSLLGQMWTYDLVTAGKLKADFETGAGAPYVEFKNWVGQRLPGANIPANAPLVTIDAAGNLPLTATSHNVLIQVYWQAPGEPAGSPVHKYEMDATVGAN
ncbi:MAG: hypothetical protein ABI569_05750 [Casimicrobiaceae bacterium]